MGISVSERNCKWDVFSQLYRTVDARGRSPVGQCATAAEGRCRVRSLQKHLAADSFKIDELVLHLTQGKTLLRRKNGAHVFEYLQYCCV